MLQWNEETIIEANIETIWNLFALENIQRIMPQVVENEVIERKEGVVGTKYRQKFKEGKRIETYIVEDLEYENTPHRKHNKSGFTLARIFEIETSFTLLKVDDKHTRFIYSGQNKGVNWLGKVMLKLMGFKNNQKVVFEFMERVRSEAMKDQNDKRNEEIR
ncbi:SRPBCC family protein [Paenibacillus sp. N3/727]|uniref:SRPBCC family protein n=1 Tax=Paenibacillus sp. N3/727 TaxID=2925845 RepID=UPI001F536EE6|nr:SRPBCC family protein [Paenibacillus sp. N3/727]UNK16293.1 SRPBCC family protein [Paenibacillus sp. N3/727]